MALQRHEEQSEEIQIKVCQLLTVLREQFPELKEFARFDTWDQPNQFSPSFEVRISVQLRGDDKMSSQQYCFHLGA